MKTYEFKVSGWISIQAETEEEAYDKLEAQMQQGLKVAELQWKETPSSRCGDGMRLTRAHADFWRARKSPHPAWYSQIKGLKPEGTVTIDGLINAHAGVKLTDYELAAHNTLAILRSARKHGDLIKWLTSMSLYPGTVIDPAKRKRYCKKWLKRINKETT